MIMSKCFGIGLNKTGTQTLRTALSILGYNTVSFRPELMEMYAKGDTAPIMEQARNYNGFTNWPWALIYKEIDARFPHSKFILTVRKDPFTWFQSLSRHAKKTGPTIYRKIAYGYVNPWENESRHITFYQEHIARASDYFATRPEQILLCCWERGDSWNQICPFLGVPIPDEPFPHENRDTQYAERS